MKALLAAGLGALTAVSIGLAPATAAGPGHQDAAAVSPGAQHRAVQHWTADRMRSATPGDELLSRTLHLVGDIVKRGPSELRSGRAASGSLLGLGPLLGAGGLLGGLLDLGGSSASGAGGSLYTGGGTVAHTTGRVFFTLDGIDYACSGSSVRARNESLVQTAGHCVNEGPGSYVKNFIFVPGYRDGRAPFGRFAAKKLYTTSQWRLRGDLNFDVGYAKVATVNGTTLADTVGAQGIAFNQARGGTVHAFGYPADGRYDGSRLATCFGELVPDNRGSSDQGLVCDMTGGTSGGPWLARYDADKGVGVITSVSSFRYVGGLFGGGRELFGPYFGAAVQRLYSTAQK